MSATTGPARVAYIFARGDLGGAELATIRFLQAHDRRRVDPFALVLQDAPLSARLDAIGVPVDTYPRGLPRLRDRAERAAVRQWLLERLTQRGAALQHAVMAWTQAVAAPAARRARIPAVWYQHNRPDLTSSIDWLAGWSYAALVLANSRYTARRQRLMNLRRTPVEIVAPPVMVPATTDGGADEVRRGFGAEPGDVVIVLAGRLQRWKGQDIAIGALARAVRDAPQLRLAIVGETGFGQEPEFRDHLARMAAERGVSDRVHFAGFQSNMTDVYRAADIVLHASREPEPYGLVIAEALSVGRPVIATDAGGAAEQVDADRTGLLVPPGDEAALAQALQRLGNDESLRGQLAAAARARPVTTPERVARRVEDLYDTIVG